MADSGVVTGAFTLGGVTVSAGATLLVERARRRSDPDRRKAYEAFLAAASLHESIFLKLGNTSDKNAATGYAL